MNIENLKCCGNCSEYEVVECPFYAVDCGIHGGSYCESWVIDNQQKKHRKLD